MMRTRLTLTPGANGTKKLVERYGNRLICVRYRYDEARRVRIKTVELVEEESSWLPPAELYLVKITFEETELGARIKQGGGVWDAGRKLWRVPRETVRRLHLEQRIMAWSASE